MTDDARPPPSTLKGRLADVYVPALVDGALEALSRRLGNRATVDDPVHGRASSLASLEPLLQKTSAAFTARGALYRHVYSTTGIDRDAAEGVLSMSSGGQARELPIAVVAERRRLREIELRLYYAGDQTSARRPRGAIVAEGPEVTLPESMTAIVEGLRKGDVEGALAGLEEGARIVDAQGQRHQRRDGRLATFLAGLGAVEIVVGGAADDGRTCCVEVSMVSGDRPGAPALLSFERGDSGLVRELRIYRD